MAVVLGGPGAGKTALLDAVAAGQREQGVRVVEVTGQPLEADLAFAALVELLSSLESGAPRPGVRVDELALVSSDPLRQRLEVLRRVEELSDGPVLVVVDDAQWIDASSLSVLAFVANRISGSSVAMVVAARGEVAPPGFAAHPVVPLPRLDTLQSRLVLRRTGLDLDDSLMAAIVTASAGNPLALLELARAAASGGVTPTDTLLPMPERLERAFAAELPDLPAATRALLVLAAAGADDLGSLSAVSGAGRRAGRSRAGRALRAPQGRRRPDPLAAPAGPGGDVRRGDRRRAQPRPPRARRPADPGTGPPGLASRPVPPRTGRGRRRGAGGRRRTRAGLGRLRRGLPRDAAVGGAVARPGRHVPAGS